MKLFVEPLLFGRSRPRTFYGRGSALSVEVVPNLSVNRGFAPRTLLHDSVQLLRIVGPHFGKLAGSEELRTLRYLRAPCRSHVPLNLSLHSSLLASLYLRVRIATTIERQHSD